MNPTEKQIETEVNGEIISIPLSKAVEALRVACLDARWGIARRLADDIAYHTEAADLLNVGDFRIKSGTPDFVKDRISLLNSRIYRARYLKRAM